MTSRIVLGDMHLVSAIENIQAQAAMNIQLSAPGNGLRTGAFISEGNYLTLPDLEEAWITRGKGLQLVIHFHQDKAQLETAIVEKLKQALLWQQLGLAALAEDWAGGPSYPGTVAVFLRHSDNMAQRGKRALHKLGEGASAADVRPPEGITAYELMQVELDISISTWKPHKTKTQSSEALEVNTLATDEELLEWDDVTPVSQYTDLFGPDEDLFRDELVSSSPAHVNDMLLDEAFGTPFNIQAHLLSQLPEGKSSAAPPEAPIEAADAVNVTADGLLELFDAILRSAISEKPAKLGKGISLKRTTLQKRLSELVPSLFSPGYLPAVADRAVLLPVISHALVRLGAKESVADGKCCSNTDAQLWAVLQQHVRDGGAARKLAPLKVKPPSASAESGSPVEDDFLEALFVEGGDEDYVGLFAGEEDDGDDLLEMDLPSTDYEESDESLWASTFGWP